MTNMQLSVVERIEGDRGKGRGGTRGDKGGKLQKQVRKNVASIQLGYFYKNLHFLRVSSCNIIQVES